MKMLHLLQERTGKKTWNSHARHACSLQPRGRGKRFSNILQPVTSQWVSVRAEDKGRDAAIVKRWQNNLGGLLPLLHFEAILYFLIPSPCMSRGRWNYPDSNSGFIRDPFNSRWRTLKMRLLQGLSCSMAWAQSACQVRKPEKMDDTETQRAEAQKVHSKSVIRQIEVAWFSRGSYFVGLFGPLSFCGFRTVGKMQRCTHTCHFLLSSVTCAEQLFDREWQISATTRSDMLWSANEK